MNILRPLFKLTFLLTLLFAACIGLIHAQPYDDSDLRAFLTLPDGCPMPCFIGIRPGVTTAEEAIAILEAHEWIGEVELRQHRTTGQPDSVIWSWSGSQSHLIQDTIFGSPYRGNVQTEDGVVTSIWVPTTITTGDLWLVWGKPDEFAYTVFRNFASYYELFPTHQAVSQMLIYCPYFPVNWYARVALTLGDVSEVTFISERNTSNQFPGTIVDLHQKYC